VIANEHPTVRADAGVAIADRARSRRQINRRDLLGPTQQKVVARAVRLRERDWHLSISSVDQSRL
jgi:hypothetical protein